MHSLTNASEVVDMFLFEDLKYSLQTLEVYGNPFPHVSSFQHQLLGDLSPPATKGH